MNKKILESAASQIRSLRDSAKGASIQGNSELASRLSAEANGAEEMVASLGREFNPNFDGGRFAAACQPR